MRRHPLLAAYCLLLAWLLAGAAHAQNLTGQWQGNDGGNYWLRQVGERLWWYGERGTAFTNVFDGYVQGARIQGSWADVPRGGTQGAGELGLRIESPDRLVAERQTGGFSGTEWRRVGGAAATPPATTTAAPPATTAAGRQLPLHWTLRLQDPYASYLFHVTLEPLGPNQWRMAETLRETNHAFHRTRIGQTTRDCVLTVQEPSATRSCEGMDPNPATPGRYRAEYVGAFQGDAIRGTGRHAGALQHGVSWELVPGTGGPDFSGPWNLQFRDPYASHAYEGTIVAEGGRQRLLLVLRQSNHPFHGTRIGTPNRDCSFTVAGSTLQLVCEGLDPNPASAGPYRSEYQLTLGNDGVYRGSGTHRGALQHGTTVELRRMR